MHKWIVSLATIFLVITPMTLAQETELTELGLYGMPDCSSLQGVIPDLRIGGNITLSFGGLELYEAYIEQTRNSHLLTLDGEQLLGSNIEFEGCFVDETEFRLLGRMNNMAVLLIGMAIKPTLSEPTFGGIWFGWSGEYNAERLPDAKGFFYKLF